MLNEAANLRHVVEDLPESIYEILVIDSGSTDGTVAVAASLGPAVRVLSQTGGRGAAVAAGLAASGGDLIVVMDADGSQDPTEIPLLVGALLAGADFAKGSRFLVGGGTDMRWTARAQTRAMTRLANVLFGTSFTDIGCEFCAFWSDCVPAMGTTDVSSDRLLAAAAVRTGLRVSEVPVVERERFSGLGTLVPDPRFRRLVRLLLRERFATPDEGTRAPRTRNRPSPPSEPVANGHEVSSGV